MEFLMPEREKVIKALACKADYVEPQNCTGCPYHNADWNCCDQAKIYIDAIVLLRGPDARVLTLEECRNPERIVVVERKALNLGPDYQLEESTQIKKWAVYIGKSWDDSEKEWTQFACFRCETDYIQFPTDGYGRTWRCWSALPTEEQRKGVKWE